MKLKEAAKAVREGYLETLTCTRFPEEHRRRIRTNNAIERLDKEIRRRTKAVGAFPDGKSALMLVTARLKHVADSERGSRRHLACPCWTSDHAEAYGAVVQSAQDS